MGRFRSGISSTTYQILQQFPVWWSYIEMTEVLFCCHTNYGKVKTIVSWSMFFSVKLMKNCHVLYRTWRILHAMHLFCLFYYKMAFPSRQVDIMHYTSTIRGLWNKPFNICLDCRQNGKYMYRKNANFFLYTYGIAQHYLEWKRKEYSLQFPIHTGMCRWHKLFPAIVYYWVANSPIFAEFQYF